jgi:peptidyl-prolyl cis-trans isomerase A (cyclophilin A)
MMRHQFRFLSIAIVAVAMALLNGAPAPATIVRFQTSSGDVDVRLYNTATPNTVANFLNYVTSNRYNGSFIHRVPQLGIGSSHFVVQGGGFVLNNSIWAASAIPAFPAIGSEASPSNLRGTLAAVKTAQGATSQWYFNVGNNSFLDAQGFSVFGRVLGAGMNVVDTIDNLPAVNAFVAENAPGEDFDEIPVRDINQVFAQNDITANEAVMVGISIRNLPAADYDFNGIVDMGDFNVWQSTFGSTVNAAADGNGDGIVNNPDYDIWASSVPEPSAAIVLTIGTLVVTIRRQRRSSRD